MWSKLHNVTPALEILQSFSEAATEGVPYKRLFLKILRYA